MKLSARFFFLAMGLSAVATVPAAAESFDGRYNGASSIAGGTGDCWGNAPADATVSGGTVTIRYVTYDGTQTPVTAQVHADGSFSATQDIKKGQITYSGKVNGKRLTANWKGPVCYGTLDLTR